MNWKNWIPLALAVVLGLVAAKVARDSLERSRRASQVQPKTVKVVVARSEIAPGQELTPDLLTVGAIAADAPPTNGFTDPAKLAGRVSGTAMFRGQPIVEELLAPRGSGTGIQALVPRGMRAITVEVNETSGIAGMLVPGCRVDVMSTLNGANKDDTVACTIVQDVLVQAVGQRLTPGPAGSERDGQAVRSVTLVVRPRDAEAIELASSMGRPRLVLRGPNDRADTKSDGVSFVELRGEDPGHVKTQVVTVAPITPAASTQPTTRPTVRHPVDPFAEDLKPRRTVNLIRGSSKTEVVFELPDKPDGNGVFTKTSNEPVER